MTLLFFSDNPWHGLYQRPQHLAVRFARHYRVLWIEPITFGHKRHLNPTEVHPGIHAVSVPLLPHNARQRWMRVVSRHLGHMSVIRWILLQLQSLLLRRALRSGHYDTNNLVLFLQNFQLIRLAQRMKAPVLAFDYIDDAFGFTDLPDYIHDLWLTTLQAADVITVTSPTLNRIVRHAAPSEASKVHTVTNGVEYEKFTQSQPEPPPLDLPPGDTPLIGYIGSVYPWLDFDLLEEILKSLRASTLVLVGREHPEVGRMISRLSTYENFLSLGTRPYADVPKYLRRFEVGIIPFRKTRLTAAVNPVKLYEYSACGLPTVTTDFSPDLAGFEDLIYVAHSRREFITHLGSALERAKDELFRNELMRFARQNDWDRKASAIRTLIQHKRDQP